MSSFKHAGWSWQPLGDAPEDLVAEALADGLLRSAGLSFDELRRKVRTSDESGEHLHLVARRDGRLDAFVHFMRAPKFLDLTGALQDGTPEDLLEGLAGISAYVRDRTDNVLCLDPHGMASGLARFFPDAYTTGYHEVVEPDELDVPYRESGPPTMVLKGVCSASSVPPPAQRTLDQTLAKHGFADIEL